MQERKQARSQKLGKHVPEGTTWQTRDTRNPQKRKETMGQACVYRQPLIRKWHERMGYIQKRKETCGTSLRIQPATDLQVTWMYGFIYRQPLTCKWHECTGLYAEVLACSSRQFYWYFFPLKKDIALLIFQVRSFTWCISAKGKQNYLPSC